ncbi:DNA-formamidopyrimidine glycosylase family protein [Aurantiacibacter poecillastricola]|uniref:DNA-formamidopyrimidine glycosylase family protein n=1 Tax=Aurantiacibacter poecillastricola TaxID=3064385 RepID=UPI00273DC97D|nr:DNA-formamidopyrimidine glycosylase family protein [Aurantiacibacter sp. 219JJ12-13]MDP5261866.1 DNA-formamidopyrimidine glycosylase family protein [Aurantiacibacter sp. 219JJ12-13]
MPELPEAEANRRRIEDKCLNRTIEEAVPGDNVTYIELPGDNERARLVGRQFTETHRHGKLIFAGSKTGPWICVHLGMTGSLIPFDEGTDEQPSATKFLIRFEGDRALAFRCPRKLGWLRVVDSPEEEVERIGFGPDALEIGEDDFVEVIGGTNGAVKSALIEQKKIAGVGNLWSDEILFDVGIVPDRKANELDEDTLRKMYGVMRDRLRAVVKTNADYSQLPDDWLVRHRKKGEDCRRCGGTIRNKTVGGRSAYYCDRHQD